jgi:hypothetical protein
MGHRSTSMVIRPTITTFLSREENYTDIISDTSLNVPFPRKSYTEFLVGIGGEFSHLSRKALKILLHFATSYQCETEFSVLAAIKT